MHIMKYVGVGGSIALIDFSRRFRMSARLKSIF